MQRHWAHTHTHTSRFCNINLISRLASVACQPEYTESIEFYALVFLCLRRRRRRLSSHSPRFSILYCCCYCCLSLCIALAFVLSSSISSSIHTYTFWILQILLQSNGKQGKVRNTRKNYSHKKMCPYHSFMSYMYVHIHSLFLPFAYTLTHVLSISNSSFGHATQTNTQYNPTIFYLISRVKVSRRLHKCYKWGRRRNTGNL